MERGARALVTGGTGLIGANLVRRLMAEGVEVWVLSRRRANRTRFDGLEGRLRIVEGDLCDEALIRAALDEARPQTVFHLASTVWTGAQAASPTAHLQVNVVGTARLLEALREQPATRLVVTGSCAAYGGGASLREESRLAPGTIYGAAKASVSVLLQTYARLYGLQAVELRLFMPYGPWEHPQRLVPWTILSALAGEDIRMTSGEQQRDLVYVDDVVDALLLAATRPVPPGTVCNIGSGSGVRVRDVVELILRLMGNPVKPLLGAIPTRPDEMMVLSADITAAKARLGWQPKTSLEEGLRKSIAWCTQHRDLITRLA